jgi:hypothetical protein
MAHPVKIATCCHCGTRAALRLDQQRHALACASCGAPLSQFKALPVAPGARPSQPAAAPRLRSFAKVAEKPRKPVKAKKKRKSWLKNMAEEVFDAVEDIFD